MSSLAFVTHPSVRIKGSENVYTPVQCVDELCCIKTPHLHCPFCVKTDSYTDPVILKAHYRVKHVDKGIEFAGLKILRCCDHCDIVGVIKGEKKFKGAHWHCYRCRNGFNRRDEAIKHYKTHFRNPQTTFQISITQDLNNPVVYQTESKSAPQTPVGAPTSNIISSDSIHPALTEAVCSISSPSAAGEQDIITNGKADDIVHTSDIGEDEETIVIIQEEQLESSEIDSFSAQIIGIENVSDGEKSGPEKRAADDRARLEKRLQHMTEEKDFLKAEVSRLHRHIGKLEDSLRQSKKREEDLTSRLGNATDRGTADLLKRLETEHRTLLRQQLDSLQNYVMAMRSPAPSAVLQLTDQHGQEIQVVNASSLEVFFAGNITRSTSGEGRTTLPPSIIHNDLSPEEVSASEAATVVGSADVPVSSEVDLSTNYVMCIQNVKTEKGNGEELVTVVTRAKPVVSSKIIMSTPSATASPLGPPSKRRKAN